MKHMMVATDRGADNPKRGLSGLRVNATPAAAVPADLVVLATHGRRGFEKLLLGSVTEKVLRDWDIDALAVPPQRSS